MTTKFETLYTGDLEEQRTRYAKIERGFSDRFGSTENCRWFSAPGRTEIGGNHTDHNRGRVLAAAVDLDIVGLAKKIDGDVAFLKSDEYARTDTIPLDRLEKQQGELNSQALVRGILARCKELGYQVGPFACYTKTRVLKGSGLSSSAAFEILVVTVISQLFNNGEIDPVTAAQIAQYAENVYYEKPSGLLDQTASSVGGFTVIDFHDPAAPVIRKVDFDFSTCGCVLCVVDTGGSHSDLTAEYAAIPAEMKAVAAFFGKEVLRDVDEAVFTANLRELRAAVGDRAILRAMHFFDEDRLAEEEAKALEAGDFERFRQLVRASGRSSYERLQNVFAVSAPNQQGLSLALALSESVLGGNGAFRVHGGGFAGTIQAYVPLPLLGRYRETMEKVFGNGCCHVLRVRQAGGTEVAF